MHVLGHGCVGHWRVDPDGFGHCMVLSLRWKKDGKIQCSVWSIISDKVVMRKYSCMLFVGIGHVGEIECLSIIHDVMVTIPSSQGLPHGGKDYLAIGL